MASKDLARTESADFEVRLNGSHRALPGGARECLVKLQSKPIGVLYLNSIDQDGTGEGFDLRVIDLIPHDFDNR